MLTWIVVGMVLLAVTVPGLAVRSLLVRLPRLRRAVLRLRRRQEQAEASLRSAMPLQERVLALQRQAEATHRTLTSIKTKREP